MSASDEKVLTEAKERRARCEVWESDARSNWKEDVRFANADDVNRFQWEHGMYTHRTTDGRPCLTVNKTRQHVLMIVNDARQNKAALVMDTVNLGEAGSDVLAQLSLPAARTISFALSHPSSDG